VERSLLHIAVSIDFSLGNQGLDKVEEHPNGRTCESYCLQEPRLSKFSTTDMRVLVVPLVRDGNAGRMGANDSNPRSPSKMNMATSSRSCRKAGGKRNQYQDDVTRNLHIQRGKFRLKFPVTNRSAGSSNYLKGWRSGRVYRSMMRPDRDHARMLSKSLCGILNMATAIEGPFHERSEREHKYQTWY
jgi:hypothetical protein